MEFNINYNVWVKLTDHGRAIHRMEYDDLMRPLAKPLFEYAPVKEDADGWSEWQLWKLMETFGEHYHNGCILPFETTIRIEPCKS